MDELYGLITNSAILAAKEYAFLSYSIIVFKAHRSPEEKARLPVTH